MSSRTKDQKFIIRHITFVTKPLRTLTMSFLSIYISNGYLDACANIKVHATN